jgi:RNase P subunit RPR2
MGLIGFAQKHHENVERQRRNDIEQQKLAVMKQQQMNQQKQTKQIFCPHCGKSFNIDL